MPRRRKEIETVALPTADNAKWMGLGFLAAVVIVAIAMVVIMHVR
jgi:hypothetical protein